MHRNKCMESQTVDDTNLEIVSAESVLVEITLDASVRQMKIS